MLKRLKFAPQRERFIAEQKSLRDETVDSDLAAVAAEIEAVQQAASLVNGNSPAARSCRHTCRHDVCHEPENTSYGCSQARWRNPCN